MRVIVTGQVGIDKAGYLQKVAVMAKEQGIDLPVYHVGKRMYEDAGDIPKGRILDLPLSRLSTLRRSVMKDVLRESEGQQHAVLNTHATFRWRHGLFAAFDFDQLQAFKADMVVCMVDNVEVIAHRLQQEHSHLDVTLKDLMVWREEEIMASELLAQGLGIGNHCYVMSRGRHRETTHSMYRLLCQPECAKVYPSFPMTHVVKMPEVLKVIDSFRADLEENMIAFDPGDVDEKMLQIDALEAAKEGKDFIATQASSFSGGQVKTRVSVRQVLDIAGDIDGQIYARDFKMVRQSDLIVSLVPELPDGSPGLSSGVERELQHAFDHGKQVYVVWLPPKEPSPFITETATKVFRSVADAMLYFQQHGLLQMPK